MQLKPRFSLPCTCLNIDTYANRNKKPAALVKSVGREQRMAGNSDTANVMAFGDEFAVGFQRGLQHGVEPEKHYLLEGEIVNVRGSMYLRCDKATPIDEADTYQLPTWEGAGLVKQLIEREDPNTGEVSYTLAIASHAVSLRFYGVSPDLAGSLSLGELIQCTGTFGRAKKGTRYELATVERVEKPKAKNPPPKQSKKDQQEKLPV